MFKKVCPYKEIRNNKCNNKKNSFTICPYKNPLKCDEFMNSPTELKKSILDTLKSKLKPLEKEHED